MVIVGRTKIPYNDLFILSRGEIDAILEGHEIDYRDDWERTRAGVMIGLAPHLKKGASIKPHAIMPLPWDKIENTDNLVERAKEKIAKLKARNGRIRN